MGGARYEEKSRKHPGLDLSEAVSGLRRDPGEKRALYLPEMCGKAEAGGRAEMQEMQ